LGIAIGGYDDPRSPHLVPDAAPVSAGDHPLRTSASDSLVNISRNYAFFPFYPVMIRIFALPLSIFGMNAIATATLAGVTVSALGALLGMLALYDLTRESLGEDGALRAIFYLIIFPTGFFLLQVYTEGLFIGLAFGCLAALKRKYWLLAALLAAVATLTRAVGVLLIIPMLMTWFRTGDCKDLYSAWRQVFQSGVARRSLYHAFLAIVPIIVFFVWRISYLGFYFDYVETREYGRGFLNLGSAFSFWATAFVTMIKGDNPQHTAYYITEFIGLILGAVTSVILFRSQPEIAWFSFAVVIASWASGPAQGIHRYILGAPAVFFVLAQWGRHPVFDRAWTLFSILMMGALATLFAFNMWVA
jgi:hypothetical protein